MTAACVEALSSNEARDVYLALVVADGTTVDDAADELDLSRQNVTHALEGLEDLGLVSWTDGLVHAVWPRRPLEQVARDHLHRASQARQAAHDLGRLWPLHQGRADYIEVVPGIGAARHAQARVLAESTDRVRALSIVSNPRPHMAEGLIDTLQRGVTVQSIYGAEVLAKPAAMDVVQECIANGEQSRVFPTVPMNLLICDDNFAMTAVQVESDRRADAIVVHASDMLESLIGIFETFWGRAVPIAPTISTDPTDRASLETQHLLTNLAAGLDDHAIANDLDMSKRTVRRRVNRLQELSGSETRFQLGVEASRRGWL